MTIRQRFWTNNPPFDYQMTNLSNYLNLTPGSRKTTFPPSWTSPPTVRAWGLWACQGPLLRVPVRAGGLHRLNAVSGPSEAESVSQFFHILAPVAQSGAASGRRPVRNHRLLLLLQHGSWHLLLHHLRQPSDYRRGPPRGKPGGNPSCVLSPRHRTANPGVQNGEQNLKSL